MSTLAAYGIAFYILIEHLVRIEIRTVSGKKEHSDMSLLRGKPLFNLCALMHRMAVNNQEHLALALADQAVQKIDEDLGGEMSLKPNTVHLMITKHHLKLIGGEGLE
jgi:hypothetical protein